MGNREWGMGRVANPFARRMVVCQIAAVAGRRALPSLFTFNFI
jgi:hypothetical protein